MRLTDVSRCLEKRDCETTPNQDPPYTMMRSLIRALRPIGAVRLVNERG